MISGNVVDINYHKNKEAVAICEELLIAANEGQFNSDVVITLIGRILSMLKITSLRQVNGGGDYK